MRRLASTLLPVLSLAACHSATPATAPPPTGPRAELVRAMDASAAAWNRGDMAGHVALYTDSAAMMGKNGPVVGREVIRGLLERGFWSGGTPAQQLAFADIAVTPLGRDHAMLTGKCILTGGGKPQYTCRFTTIWERTTAGWRIIHDHSS
jgi:ketosteroid isomerase-like protein